MQGAGGGAAGNEQRAADALVHVLLRGGDRVDHAALVHVVRFLVEPLGQFVQVRHGVDGAGLVAGAGLDAFRDGHDAGRRVADVTDAAGRGDRHDEGVRQPVRPDVLYQLPPVLTGGEMVTLEQRGDLGRAGSEVLREVLREVLAALVAAALEAPEHEARVARDLHAGAAGVVVHGREVHVHELQRLGAAVRDFVLRQERVQAHGAQAHAAHLVVGALDGRDFRDAGAAGHVVQHAHGGAHHAAQVATGDALLDHQRREVAAHVQAHLILAFLAVRVEGAGQRGLQDLAAQVAHLDRPDVRDGVHGVRVALEQQVRVPALALRDRDLLHDTPRRHALLADVRVRDQRVVLARPVDTRELAPRRLEQRVRVELVDVLTGPDLLHEHVRHGRPDRQGLQARVLVRRDLLGAQGVQEVGVHDAQVDRPRARPLPGLIGVAQHVVQHLRHAHHALRDVLNAAQTLATRAQVTDLHADPAAALAEFRHERQRLRDGIQVVRAVLQEEAADQPPRVRLPGVHQGGRGRRERLVHQVMHEFQRLLDAAAARQGRHAQAILEALQPLLAVRGHGRVLAVELERPHERPEPEVVPVRPLEHGLHVTRVVAREHRRVPHALLGHVRDLLGQRRERHGIRVHLLREVRLQRLRVMTRVDVRARKHPVVQFNPAFHTFPPHPAGASAPSA